MDSNDKVWQIFLEYQSLIGTEGKRIGLDIFGTDQVWSMALELTKAHFFNNLDSTVNSLFAPEELRRSC